MAKQLFICTDDALYSGTRSNGTYETKRLGLQGTGGVRALAIDRKDPKRMYAATGERGMYRSTDAGKSWQEINEGIVYKEGWSLIQHPKTGDLYYGTGPSAIFKSTDGGDSWTDCAQLRSLPTTKEWDFPTPPHVSHVRHLNVVDDDPNIVMGAVEVGWLLRSEDAGATWTNLQTGVDRDSHSIWPMPDDASKVVATTGRGIYRSEDGGATFVDAKEGLNHVYMTQIVVHPKRPKVLFTAGAETPPHLWFRRPEGANTGFYRSTDQGKSWEQLRGGLPELIKPAPRAVCGDPDDENAFFVGMIDGSVWQTADGGESFKQVLTGLPGWVRFMKVLPA